APKLCLKFEWIGENSAFECLCNKAVKKEELLEHDHFSLLQEFFKKGRIFQHIEMMYDFISI
ncbi:hypothetical protein VXR13_18835, partial [Acinetobacter baumannii]